MVPWLFFLFVGVLDFGFYAYAAICTQNAARVAAIQTASDSSLAGNNGYACTLVLPEMSHLPNATNLSTCATSASAVNDTQPVAVVASSVTGPDGNPATQVAVTYRTIPMIPIPGVMMGRMTLTRVATMRVQP